MSTKLSVSFLLAFCLLCHQIKSQSTYYRINIFAIDSIVNNFGLNKIEVSYGDELDTIQYFAVPGTKTIEIKTDNTDWISSMLEQVITSNEGNINSYQSGHKEYHYIDLFSIYFSQPAMCYSLMSNGGQIKCRFKVSLYQGAYSGAFYTAYSDSLIFIIPPASLVDLEAFTLLLQKKDSIPSIKQITSFTDPTNSDMLAIYDTLINEYPSSIFAKFSKIRIAANICRQSRVKQVSSSAVLQVQQVYNEMSVSEISILRDLAEKLKACVDN